MNLRPRRSEEPEVNLTPLIDVVFLLLVFFMVSTTFVREADLEIILPEASLEGVEEAPDRPLEVVVSADGVYYVNGRELVNSRPETLDTAIRRVIGDDRDVPVTIRADANARHQSVVTVMDVAGKLGFSQIQVVTAEETEPDAVDEERP
ncbi:biopolymer transport protein ExbD [Natronospira proteinivora]|uniref:Biopolymer transport protein ExbD n=1 Tax=Natronospira proteinivora TaxID=1807133 RepID=A0ABT1G5Y1_9GAMM|nr:biopolymer transporter ExbD [Natronospira proteinivora]MCP1726704.1 biopolymer transport protein ExbD [Natronospira proteinivora]